MNRKAKGEVATIIGGILVVLFLVGVISWLACTRTIPAGYVGILTEFGATTGKVLEPGLHFINPFVNGVQTYDTKVQIYTDTFTAASIELQDTPAKIALNYKIDSEKVVWIFENIGSQREIISKIITPILTATVKDATTEFTAAELPKMRPEIAARIEELLTPQLSKYNIVVDDVSVVDISYSPEYNAMIEAKQAAEQNVLKAQQELEKAKIDAEKRIAEAEAEAETQRLLNEELSDELLQKLWIETWDGQLPTIVGSDFNIYGLMNMSI